jgi:branched-chain amino acid transport system ATP-binding protein
MGDSLLRVENVSKHFGGLTALHQVGFSLESRRIKGLIGPNGAGKTTLFNLITGIYPVSAGSIYFNGNLITNLAPFKIARRGIARTFQNVKLFPNLTLLENVLVGSHTRMKAGMLSSALNLPWIVKEEIEYTREARQLLQFVGLAEQSACYASALPFGQQRLLEIARALATKPQLLLLDEPAAGLSNPERVSLAGLIRSIRDSGVTILLVEHNMDLVMKVCEEIVVLEYGSKIAEGEPKAIQNDRQVIAAYLGEEVDNA